jgi:hypothetical protein
MRFGEAFGGLIGDLAEALEAPLYTCDATLDSGGHCATLPEFQVVRGRFPGVCYVAGLR